MLQIAIAHSLHSEISENEIDEAERRRMDLRMDRLTYSGFGYLADEVKGTDRNLPSLSVYRHLQENLNPWHRNARNLAASQADAEAGTRAA